MQHLADLMVAGVGWFLLLLKVPTLRQRQGRNVGSFWLFLLCFAISFTFQIDPLYVAFDEMLGWPNLSWYLSYFAIVVGLVFMADTCRAIAQQPPTYEIALVAALVIGYHTWLYLTALRFSPESLHHDFPATHTEWLFIVTLHLYCLSVILIPLRLLWRMWQQESLLSGSLRTASFLGAIISTESWLALKLLHVIGLAWFPSLVANLPKVFPLLMFILGLSMFGALIPGSAYARFAHRLEQTQTRLALLATLWLGHRLGRLCPSRYQHPVPLGEQLHRGSFYLRRQIVYLSDCRKMLAGIELVNDPHLQGAINELTLEGLNYDETVRLCCKASLQLLWHDLPKLLISPLKGIP